MEGEIMSFPAKRRLKNYISTKPALQEMLKELLKKEESEKEREAAGREMRNEKHRYRKNVN